MSEKRVGRPGKVFRCAFVISTMILRWQRIGLSLCRQSLLGACPWRPQQEVKSIWRPSYSQETSQWVKIIFAGPFFIFMHIYFIIQEVKVPKMFCENNSVDAISEIISPNCVLRDDQVSRMIKRRDRPSTFCCWPIEQKMYFSRWWEKGFWCHRTATTWRCWIRVGHWLV